MGKSRNLHPWIWVKKMGKKVEWCRYWNKSDR